MTALICPDCRSPMSVDDPPVCSGCRRTVAVDDGVIVALPHTLHDITSAEVEYWEYRAGTDESWMVRFYSQDTFGIDAWGLYTYNDVLLSLPTDARILEVGSGTQPKVLSLVLDHGFTDVTVTDLSVAQLKTNRAFCKERNVLPFVTHVAADMAALPFPDNAFDAVMVHAALHHVPDHRLALAEMIRVTKSSGRVIVGHEPNERVIGAQRRVADRLHIGEKYSREAYSKADEQLAGLYPGRIAAQLTASGVRVDRVTPQWFTLAFAQPLPMVLRKVGIPVNSLPGPVMRLCRLADRGFAWMPFMRNWSAHFTVVGTKA